MHLILDSFTCAFTPISDRFCSRGDDFPLNRAGMRYTIGHLAAITVVSLGFAVAPQFGCSLHVARVAFLILGTYTGTNYCRILNQEGEAIRIAVRERAEGAEEDDANDPNAPLDENRIALVFKDLVHADRTWAIDLLLSRATKPLFETFTILAGVNVSEHDNQAYVRIIHRLIVVLAMGAFVSSSSMATSALIATAAIVTGLYASVAAVYEYARMRAENAFERELAANPERAGYRIGPLRNNRLWMVQALFQHVIETYHRRNAP